MTRLQLLGSVAVLAALLSPVGALAEYPDRDVRVIVPWGAGGGTDGIVRKITNIVDEQVDGGSFYVENIEGGISATGISQLMKAKPDGYTIGALTYDSVITVPWQGLLPSYNLDKLKLFARITSEPDAVIVDATSDYKTIEDLIAAAKANPGEIRVGVQNLGGRIHLTLLQFQSLTGTDFKIVSYSGGTAGQKEAILSDELDVVITSLGDFSTLIDDGTVRGLLEFTKAPNPTYDVPTSEEAGIDLVNGSFILLAAPAGTPDDIISTLETDYKAAYDSDEFQSWVAKTGVTPDWLGAAAVTQWVDETQKALFDEMNSLVESGVITK
ncbi:Bug family tripartite tricarboxylate transporter substrate binding protein [Martelella radicis]|uniref:Tripartite-type tricarboxylate transporter receptor subunit TctC n=1 Tax=Martelella radicis TaxID=1397476 RepID=A0A7W6KH43_9HYPH|nr:tripartite tricarboxylate transporter substrate binding protein [Martelella radicis]MBB4121126.1 tripartite-type tricarboxylate transporter receptor subunit TctC [Martelella radicis]